MVAMVVTVPIFAQQEAGQINGTVKDPTEALIPGATVTVRNTATNATRTVTTDNDGNYLVTNLQPGAYEVIAVKQGFQDAKGKRPSNRRRTNYPRADGGRAKSIGHG